MFRNNAIQDRSNDFIIQREEIEWSNFWWDSANKEVEKRYLLIGDSTARMVRSTLACILNAPVDMLGSSSNLDDVLFTSQVDAFFASSHYRKYNTIFVQMGHHGRIGKDGGDFSDADFDDFKNSLKSFLSYLSQYSNSIIVESIFDSVIPPVKRGEGWLIRHHFKKETLDESINKITRRKNQIAELLVPVLNDLANGSHYQWFDINKFSTEAGFLHTDHIHFQPVAIPVIAAEMKKYCQ